MNKLKQILLSTDTTVLVFVLIGLRVTVMGASIGDAIAILGLCALQGGNAWMTNLKDVAEIKARGTNDQLKQEMTDIKNHVSAILIKNSVRPSAAPVSDAATIKKFF